MREAIDGNGEHLPGLTRQLLREEMLVERWRSGINRVCVCVGMGGRLVGRYCVVCFFCNIFELDLIAVYMTCNITYNVVIHVMDSKL